MVALTKIIKLLLARIERVLHQPQTVSSVKKAPCQGVLLRVLYRHDIVQMGNMEFLD